MTEANAVADSETIGKNALSGQMAVGRGDALQRRAWQRFRRHRLALVGIVMLLMQIIPIASASLITKQNPIHADLSVIGQPPSREHIFGTDHLGRDVFTRVLYGGRISLSVGLVAVGIYCTIGTLIGATAGYAGGKVDMVLMRFTDMVMCFPSMIIMITVAAILGPSIFNTMMVIGVLGWEGLARLVRGQVLSLREQDFIMATRMVGVPRRIVLLRHIVPNVISPIVVAATLGIAGAILTEASLSFLGLGVPPPTPSWGNMLIQAQNIDVLDRMPWIWLPPGLMITMAVLSITFIGDALRDALDPRASLE